MKTTNAAKVVASADFTAQVPNKRTLLRPYWLDGFFYFGDQKRVATLTDIKHIGDDMSVVAHREAATLHLVKRIHDTYETITKFTIDMRRLSQRFFHPDLMAMNGNKIYMTEYGSRCIEVQLNDNRFRITQRIHAGDYNYHGIHYENGFIYLGADREGIVTIINECFKKVADLQIDTLKGTNKRIKTFSSHQDLFITGIDLPYGLSHKPNQGGDTWVSLLKKSGTTLTEIQTMKFRNCQVDGHKFHNGLHYFSLDDGNDRTGKIVVIKVKDETLTLVHEIICDDFPHGIDILNGELSYTSYATSMLKTISLSATPLE